MTTNPPESDITNWPWEKHQAAEASHWGNCVNTRNEEIRQRVYAQYMGLKLHHANEDWYDVKGARVLDIGGGPISLLLKCANLAARSVVMDPCHYPEWVTLRYDAAGIHFWRVKAEDMLTCPLTSVEVPYSECWFYNLLQHVENPEDTLRNALAAAPVLRMFDWLDTPIYPGHPNSIKREWLEKIIGETHVVECVTVAEYLNCPFYAGVFVRT